MKKHEQYSVGAYCRLSKDDVNGGSDSSSIISQKTMLEKYARDNGWSLFDYYVDDGYSGTNYNRPDFQRMIEDIEAGKINLVVVKDLSRLGRNYLLTGQYTDIYFPDRGVRFIAVNDGIDTKNADNDIAPFKNILNEMYAKDISKKIRSVMRAKQEKGEYIGNHAPYGYSKDPANKNHLIIEESGAKVVRRIYDLCAAGNGSPTIVKTLNQEGIPTPRNHLENICPNYYKEPLRQYKWSTETVLLILRSRIYKGDMVQGVYETSLFNRTPTKRRPRDERIIVPNTHEPIINDDLWNYVQKCLDTRKRVMKSGEPQLFAGFVRCPDCGYALAYAKRFGTEYYSCSRYRRHGAEHCSQHYINKQVLIGVVLDDIKKHAQMAQDDAEGLALKLAAQNGDRDERQAQALSEKTKVAEARYVELDRIIEQLYEDKVARKLSDTRFGKLIVKYEAEQSALEKRIEEQKSEAERLKANKRDAFAWLELVKHYADIRELDRIILGELVEKITVGEALIIDGVKNIEITIYYRFVGSIRL
jgi:DNA invertase Pin-like site-specific DNA recombinase